MHALDIAIVGVYFILMVVVGWVVARMAARNPESYFLAGKSLPWWMIGIAHGSSGLDVSGTMFFVTMLYVYGAKGLWLLWIWPLFNVIFRMAYLGAWVRRSNVLTGAAWMYTRFGRTRGAELAYLSIVIYALVTVIGFLSLAFEGVGKSAQAIFPWGVSDNQYAAIIMLIAGVYCVVGGMYSVVMNDLIQFALIVVASIIIGVVAIQLTSPEQIMSAVPAGWDRFFFGWRLDIDWSNLIPKLNEKLYNPFGAGGDGYSMFGLFILAIFAKGVLVSMAGPTPNYAIQHVLSTRSPREAALENMMMAIASIAPRYLLIAGIGVLGIAFYRTDLEAMAAAGKKVDFEQVLPAVVSHYLPVGCKGLILAGLLAAFMSTFVSTVNSGAAYIVNDIYKRYFDPAAPARRLVLLSYLVSVVIILIGIACGFVTQSVHTITEVLVSGIVPAFVIPNIIKWHWWRFNGWGFFAGMVAGTGSALVLLSLNKPGFMALFDLAPLHLHPVYVIAPVTMLVSAIASVGFCLATAPEDEAVLKRFYRTVRPWGFWRPILEKCRAETPTLQPNRDFARDWFNIAVGIVWEMSMVVFPVFLLIGAYSRMAITAAVFILTSVILKFTWYDHLGPGQMYLPDAEPSPAEPGLFVVPPSGGKKAA
jgi:Na+/proline symporter